MKLFEPGGYDEYHLHKNNNMQLLKEIGNTPMIQISKGLYAKDSTIQP